MITVTLAFEPEFPQHFEKLVALMQEKEGKEKIQPIINELFELAIFSAITDLSMDRVSVRKTGDQLKITRG